MKTVALLILAILLPMGIVILLPLMPSLRNCELKQREGSFYALGPLRFDDITVGPDPIGHPRITNVQFVKLEESGSPGVLVCDAGRNAVLFYTKEERNSIEWKEQVIMSDVVAPAHATVVDIDGDSDLDVLVAVLGNIEPDDGAVGRLLLLERVGDSYKESVLLDDVRRVADVQPGDFDNDEDIDLAVAVFGYNRGQVLWLENRSHGRFLQHELLSGPGIIHVPVADFDNDGDLDIAAGVTQDEEEVWGFENNGDGSFAVHKLWFTHNFDFGSAGLLKEDLDQDGDVDLILPAGDNLEDFDPYPQPYHGCYYLENVGDWQFKMKRIASLGGTYAAATGDLDGDGDIDLALVSMANVWDEPGRASVVWLENDGNCDFTTHQIASSPTHLVTVAIGDINQDCKNDIIAGGLHIRGPYNRIGRVTAWLNSGDATP